MQDRKHRSAVLSLGIALALLFVPLTNAGAFHVLAASDPSLELGPGAADDGPRAGPRDPLPVPRKDGLGPAPSATPSKSDREDLLLGGESPFADSAARKQALSALYDELKAAPDTKTAEPIMEAIEQAWRSSGSDTVNLLMTRVDALVLSAKLDLAADMLDAVTEIAPDDAEAWHQRGIVSFMQKDSRRAISELRRALSIDPNHYKALRDLGMALQQTGDIKGAIDAYRQALEINPFLEQAKRAVDELAPDLEGRDI